MLKDITSFVTGSVRLALRGNRWYFAWIGFLGLLVLWGVTAWMQQVSEGLIATNMRDQVSWAFYIGNFTFLVGVAAAAVMLVIPAYIYNWKPIKEIAIFGELLAVSAIIMSMLFVLVDVGRPDRVWHLMPIIGSLNLPTSLLGWDVLVLNLYLILNLVIVLHLLFTGYHERPFHPGRGGDPHSHRLRLRGHGGEALLELGYPRSAVPRLGLLLGACDSAHPLPDSPADHLHRDQGRGDLEDCRAHGLRHVPQPLPLRRRTTPTPTI